MNTYIKHFSPILLGIFFILSCDSEQVDPIEPNDHLISAEMNTQDKINKITGDIHFIWTTNKGMENGKKPEDLLAFASITAHETKFENLDRNNFTYTILNADMTLHREIVIAVNGVLIDSDNLKGYVTGVVVSDTKGCAGGPNGGHSSGCQGGSCAGGADVHDGGCSHDTGDTDHSDGGCTGDHTDTDGGCTGDHTDTGSGSTGGPADSGGGCSGDHTDTDGGCSGDHTDTDGGCSGDHTDTDGGCSGSGDTGHSGGSGNTVSGKNCRVGQIIALKVHDVSTPGAGGDGITWKWFDPEGLIIPSISDINAWPHLCKKNIVEGNIILHTK